MKPGERLRVRFVFAGLGMVPVFLAGWLGYLQVLQAGELPRGDGRTLPLVAATAASQGARKEVVPQPRGTIVDRSGNVLAIDREVYEVRARITIPRDARKSARAYLEYLVGLADELGAAMAADPAMADRLVARDSARSRFLQMFASEFKTADLADLVDVANAPLPAKQPLVGDVRLAGRVDELPVIEALREIGERRGSVAMDFLHSFQRSYPERELTYGVVGHIDTEWQTDPVTGRKQIETIGRSGLESYEELAPGASTRRAFRLDGKGRPYFLAPLLDTPQPTVVHATVDIDLQRVAERELTAQCEEKAEDPRANLPVWGSLVLVEIATGDVLAAASWHRGMARDAERRQALAKGSSWTPYQNLFEPGSIVKPLVIAYALEAGAVDWEHEYDCAPNSATYRERIGGLGRRRPVRDDHNCSLLTPHGIIVNSSNIGASYIGLGLEREQWHDYMRFYGFGTSLGLKLPNEFRGGTNPRSFDPATPIRSFRANSAISFSFGYELQVNAFQIARAYLRLFRGSGSELRICRGIETDGDWQAAPVSPVGAKFSPHVIDAVRAAMVDVVSSDEHATGSHMHHRMLKELGIDLHGLVAGKTGTAVSQVGVPGHGKMEMRNASFVGFLPVEQPRWLAVCVLQKDDHASFYGGSYAAPPAVRLLLQTQSLEERRLFRQESHVTPVGQDRAMQSAPGIQAEAGGLQRQPR
jgi:cell division protein FtsI (penicillin-binding protein 3)